MLNAQSVFLELPKWSTWDMLLPEGLSVWIDRKFLVCWTGRLQVLLRSYVYRHFIQNYGVIAKPLTTLLQKDVPWCWTTVEQAAFDQLKAVVCQAPVLVLPNFHEPFCVETNVSGQGVGAVLQQNGRLVAFFSKALGVKYQAMSIYEKEMLAVLLAD
ncbi:peroxidase 64 [Gossypium australe]|uniref:Peroxidase 64 n=1 Tax=Gossypium australe TaxID=47621 RepID=A0A5B6UTW5_9ROSI|nr:peroxidase 64 [Gossypium australe]